MGARQHASIVPKLQPDERGHDAMVLGHDEQFVKRLFELGYDDIAPGHFEAAFKGTALPHSIYAVFKQGDRTRNDSHYHRCSRHGRPMMMVKMARTYAELEWDCITVHPDEEAYRHRLRSFLLAVRFLFGSLRSGKQLFPPERHQGC